MIDVVIPTQFDPARRYTLVHQIKSALNQEVDARVILLCSKENWNMSAGEYLNGSTLTTAEEEKVIPFLFPDGKKGDPFNTPEGYMCNPAILAYLESDVPAPWQLQTCDDDCLAPWALKYLLAASEGQGMVVGRAIAVNRDYADKRDYLLGNDIRRCHVALSSCIINTAAIRSLPKPWFNVTTGYGDWELIDRLARHFPYRYIPQIVNINSLTL